MAQFTGLVSHLQILTYILPIIVMSIQRTLRMLEEPKLGRNRQFCQMEEYFSKMIADRSCPG